MKPVTLLLSIIACIINNWCSSQPLPQTQKKILPQFSKKVFGTAADGGVFGISTVFIENKGQYGTAMPGHSEMGKIRYGFEGFTMPVLFTDKGIIHLQRKVTGLSKQQSKTIKENGRHEEEWEKRKAVDKVITMQWLNANQNVHIIASDIAPGYHTYGLLQQKAKAYKKIVYKDLYPHIDVEYYFTNTANPGFEYNIILKPGADISAVKMQFDGDVKSIKTDYTGRLLISSSIQTISETAPIGYYENNKGNKIPVPFLLNRNTVGFALPANAGKNRTFIIDPFLTVIATLNGSNTNTAKDIDFDYAGNIYVTGGGDTTSHKIAKYNTAGVLQWTFSGSLTTPSWRFGSYYGGWTVEKTTGNIYAGQGAVMSGPRIIRLNTAGLYDNYISNADPNFQENWKMFWNCNSGAPQLFIGGGGTTTNLHLGRCSPPSTTIAAANITGIAGGHQDISDLIIDPATNSMYTIFASSLNATNNLSNRIYKHNPPYTGATIGWNTLSGFTSMQEAQNRPSLAAYSFSNDNSSNILAVNSTYLFYWDGRNLKAFNKATGAAVGAPYSVIGSGYFPMDHQGIVADECNTIFVGGRYGIINVYKFTGSGFDDSPPDINFSAGSSYREIHDLAYDPTKNLLYACGIGFVAAFDISSYCPAAVTTLNISTNCIAASATATLNPAPPAGSGLTYTLLNGATPITTNTSGVFTGLSANITYTVTASVNQPCRVIQTTRTFLIPGPSVTLMPVNTPCNNVNGSIVATASGSTAPYTYSIDGVNFQSGPTFFPLAAGTYTITVKDANGCRNTATTTVSNINGPSFTTAVANATCGGNNGNIIVNGSASSGVLTYSIDGVSFQPGNIFSGLSAGTYSVTVKDVGNCTATSTVIITNLYNAPAVTASATTTTCGNANGSVIAAGSGGSGPFTYSINGGSFQAATIFSGLAAGNYTVTVKDANNCTATTTVAVQSSTTPSITAAATATTCGNANGSVIANGSGGQGVLSYSINGANFQAGNTFTNLAAGLYTITVKDAGNCTATVSVSVTGSAAGPSVNASQIASTCEKANGGIIVNGNGGTGTLNYSIDGTNFQTGNIFSALMAGTYTATVKDANNCRATTTILVTNIGIPPSVSVVSTPSTCGSSNGSIMVNSVGGTAPYQYSFNGGSTFQAGNLFMSLAAGSYTVVVKDVNGCINTAQAVISTSSPVIVNAGNDTAVCEGKSIQLSGNTNTASFSWSPSAGLTNQAILSPVASPVATTNYVLTATNGTCTQSDTVIVQVKPAPVAQAGQDTSVCFGQNVQLAGQGGAAYQWSPASYLSSTIAANPVALKPLTSITYYLTVTAANGCNSLLRDSVLIKVTPAAIVFAGRDTAIVFNQPLQLSAIDVNNAGFVTYLWTPPFGLNNTTIKNPLVVTDRDITYIVAARTPEGCEGNDNIQIKIFKSADIYVPGAFTPNADGRNDLLRPTLIGIKELRNFTVFNRYGQTVYSAKVQGGGWNGSLNSAPQPTGTYIWVAEAVDYLGNTLTRKGTSVLIR